MAIRKSHRSTAHSIIRAAFESLEPRRMLTVVLTGTPGADEIDMQQAGSNTNIYIDGSLVSSTSSETNFVLNGSDGNDHFDLSAVALNEHVTINGGNGNDVIQVSDTSFTSIQGTIDVQGGADSDQLVVNDTGNNTPLTYYIDNTGMGYFNGNKHVVTVENDVETQFINLSNAANLLYVGSTETGMNVNLAGGNDTVNFGGGDSIIPTNLAAATFVGGSGTDDALFDDSAQVFPTGGVTYNITSTGALNQTLSGFEQLDLNVGTRQGGAINQLTLTGNPGLSTLNVTGSTSAALPNSYNVAIGTTSSRVDFDALNLATNFQLNINNFSIADQDLDNSNNAWVLYNTTANTGTQVINKGSMTMSLPGKVGNVFTTPNDVIISGGSTADVFEIAGLWTLSLELYGGAGNDSLLFVNFAGNNHAGDLTSIIEDGFFYFQGDSGTDSIAADDSAGAVGAGNNDYKIFNLSVFGGDAEIDKSNQPLIEFDAASTENVNFIADNGNNQIAFSESPNDSFQLSLNGGAGNDTFTNLSALTGFSVIGPVSLIGGSGTDELLIEDGSYGVSQSYGFTGSAFWAGVNVSTQKCTYDSTLESARVDVSNAGGFVQIESKTAALRVSVFGGNGNDQFFVGGDDLDSNGLSNVTISGGAGADSLEFDDRNDAYSSSEREVYQLNGDELDKGTFSQAYTNFESLTLRASTNGTNIQAFGSTINVNTTDVPTTIYGAITRSAIINVGDATAGDLVNIAAPVTLVMGSVGGAFINDQNSSGDKTYTFPGASLAVSSGQIIYFSGAPVTLNANGGNNTININSTTAAAPLTIKANGGNDLVSIGGGNLAGTIVSVPTADGGAGTDILQFDDSVDPTFRSGTISATSFSFDRSYTYQTNMETLKVLTGTGGSSILINATPMTTNLAGGIGDDSFGISKGNLDAALLNNVVATGGGGTNSMLLDDHTDTGNDNYAFSTANVFSKSTIAHTVTASGFDSYTLSCNTGNNGISADSATPVTVLGNAGVDGIDAEGTSTILQHITPNVTFDGGTGLDVVNVNAANVGFAVVKFTNTQDLSSISAGTGGSAIAVAGSGLVLVTKTVTLASSAFLDLNNNDMIVDYTGSSQLSSIVTSIRTARGNGTWNGASGITSTSAKTNSPNFNTTLGAMEATDYKSISALNTTFDGQPIDNTAVLVKYTYYGDANFNGQVDGGDYARIDFTFGQEQSSGNIGGWINGDFNGDGKIDGSDYGLIDFAFSSQAAALRPGAGQLPQQIQAPPAQTR